MNDMGKNNPNVNDVFMTHFSKFKENTMNRKTVILFVLVAVLVLTVATTVFANGDSDLAALRAATAQFHRTEAAQAAGWDWVEGLDHCFDNQPVGAMGYHLINLGILDGTVNELEPEAMVYTPGPNGQLNLGAVEYIVDIAAWEAAGNVGLPSVLGQSFHAHPTDPVYVLHVWLWKYNPAGMFEDWNSQVSCP